MPRDRSLGEYLAVLNLLGKLVARLFEHLVVHCAFPISFVSSSISLLVVCRLRNSLKEDQSLARASIGFSLTGYKRNRPKLIRERTSNLPMLQSIIASPKILEWKPGNCAEAETFARLDFMRAELMGGVEQGEVDLIAISLTLKLSEQGKDYVSPMRGKPFCHYCSQLAEKMSAHCLCGILDIAFLGR